MAQKDEVKSRFQIEKLEEPHAPAASLPQPQPQASSRRATRPTRPAGARPVTAARAPRQRRSARPRYAGQPGNSGGQYDRDRVDRSAGQAANPGGKSS
jgi:hypothetical protein